ncbi:hypothetical protein [Parapedobacter tibetensis]|uniref:hypothetical protein n=1 Tax=Parapedobacter tibetensis TaxID=2972951 RepID=UPI00214D6A01|nr:hypothetical protein [Parapedobacter tibetensis]
MEDKSKVNKLRTEVGMIPQPEAIITEYRAGSGQGDLHTDTGFNAWRRGVGWIK